MNTTATNSLSGRLVVVSIIMSVFFGATVSSSQQLPRISLLESHVAPSARFSRVASVDSTMTVNTYSDAVAANPAGSPFVSGTTVTLRSAIQYANNHTAKVYAIVLPGGKYTLTISGANENNAATGDLDINTSMVIQGAGMNSTYVDGNGIDRVFSINPIVGTAPTVTFAQFGIINGNAPGGSDDGGGIQIQNAAVTLDTVAVDSNTAGNNGGGINISTDAGSTLVMNGGRVNYNAATGNDGGGACFNLGTVTMSNVVVSHNSAGFDGGGIANIGTGANVSVIGGNISSNQAPADWGGGIYSEGSTVTVSNAMIDHNSAQGGGGISLLSASANIVVTGSTIKLNTATSNSFGGGGIYTYNGSRFKVTNSSLDQNGAYYGGAINLYNVATGDSLINVTMDQDTAVNDGAAVYDGAGGGVQWIGGAMTNCVVTGGSGYAYRNTSGFDILTYVSLSGNSPSDYSASNVTYTAPLAVQFSSLNATTKASSVTLTWQTVTEVDNAGFNILRKEKDAPSFTLISEYRTNPALRGAGTSNAPRKYSFTDNTVVGGVTYEYRVQGVSTTGETKDLSTLSVSVGLPQAYVLYQNFPNPFNPSTTIRFDLNQPSMVTLRVYNILGQLVISRDEGLVNAGRYDETVDLSNFATGIYLYRIAATGLNGERFVSVRRMSLIK